MLKLKDIKAKARILSRLSRAENGNLGDAKSIGNGLFELRIDYGPGYRIYYTIIGRQIVFLINGGDKSSQQKDIIRAKKIMDQIRGEK